jgi:uncharacterized membrane protein YccC
MMRRMNILLGIAIGLGLLSIALQLWSHVRWHRAMDHVAAQDTLIQLQAARITDAELDARKLACAHKRVAKALQALDLRVPRQRRRLPPPPTWQDDDLATRRMHAGETFLPVSFEHDLW